MNNEELTKRVGTIIGLTVVCGVVALGMVKLAFWIL